MSRSQRGFTLLEVMIAVFVLGTVVGALVTLVQSNLHRLGDARRELSAGRFAHGRALAILAAGDSGNLPEPGVRAGRYPEPDDDLLWEEVITPVALTLPDGWTGPDVPSALFEPLSTTQPPALYRAEVRVYPEYLEPESVDPYVVLVVERAQALGLEEPNAELEP